MTQNLRLVGPKTLTQNNSDVTSNYTLPTSSASGWCTDSTSTCVNKGLVLDSGNTSYGVHYTWYAVTAETGTYSTVSTDAASSICPKGWTLPTTTNNARLSEKYTTSMALRSSPASFTLAGTSWGGVIGHQGEAGYYWAKKASSDPVQAYNLYFDNDSAVGPFTVLQKFQGLPVRCVNK